MAGLPFCHHHPFLGSRIERRGFILIIAQIIWQDRYYTCVITGYDIIGGIDKMIYIQWCKTLTFRILSGRRSLDAEGLARPPPVSKAPALGHLTRTFLHALVSAGGSAYTLRLRGAFAFCGHASGAGEDPLLQADFLTVANKKKKKEGGTNQKAKLPKIKIILQRSAWCGNDVHWPNTTYKKEHRLSTKICHFIGCPLKGL